MQISPVFTRNFRNKLSLGTAVLACAIGLSTLFTSCVTVNVNFPESAIQAATDDYVKELYRAKEKGKSVTPLTEPSATPKKQTMNFDLISDVWAASFRVDSPKALKIRDSLSERLNEVLTYKKSGILGENNSALLEIKKPDPTKKLLMKKVEKLVADENKDRTELYKEVVSLNGLGATGLEDVQRNFARSFQAESPSGTWIQDTNGSWTQKQ